MSSVRLTKSQIILLIVLVVTVLVIISVTYYFTRDNFQIPEPTVSERVFSSNAGNGKVKVFENLEGQPVNLEVYESKTVVITTWASWCPPCQNSLVKANELATEIKEENVDVLAVNRMEGISMANAFLKTLPSLENLIIIIDNRDQIFTETGGFTIPETMVLNSRGELIYQEKNTFTKDKIIEAVKVAIEES